METKIWVQSPAMPSIFQPRIVLKINMAPPVRVIAINSDSKKGDYHENFFVKSQDIFSVQVWFFCN